MIFLLGAKASDSKNILFFHNLSPEGEYIQNIKLNAKNRLYNNTKIKRVLSL